MERAADWGNLTIAERMMRCRRTAQMMKMAHPAFTARTRRIAEIRRTVHEEHKLLQNSKRAVGNQVALYAGEHISDIEKRLALAAQERKFMAAEEGASRQREKLDAVRQQMHNQLIHAAFEPFQPCFQESDLEPLLTTTAASKAKNLHSASKGSLHAVGPVLPANRTDVFRPTQYTTGMSSKFRMLHGLPPATCARDDLRSTSSKISPQLGEIPQATPSSLRMRVGTVGQLRGRSISPSAQVHTTRKSLSQVDTIGGSGEFNHLTEDFWARVAAEARARSPPGTSMFATGDVFHRSMSQTPAFLSADIRSKAKALHVAEDMVAGRPRQVSRQN
jgi:hypothetical protein